MSQMPEKPRKPGPEAERLKIDAPEGWEKAVDQALSKPKPEGGWPDPDDAIEPDAEGSGGKECDFPES